MPCVWVGFLPTRQGRPCDLPRSFQVPSCQVCTKGGIILPLVTPPTHWVRAVWSGDHSGQATGSAFGKLESVGSPEAVIWTTTAATGWGPSLLQGTAGPGASHRAVDETRGTGFQVSS